MTTSFDRDLLIVRRGGNLVDLKLTFILQIAEWVLDKSPIARSITLLIWTRPSIPTGVYMYQLRLWVIFNIQNSVHNFLGGKLLSVLGTEGRTNKQDEGGHDSDWHVK